MTEIIEEEMGFGKAISKFEKTINKLEKKNNQVKPINEKEKNSKLEIKGLIKLLRHNIKIIKILNNYNEDDFADKESIQKVKQTIKKMIGEQRKTMDTFKDSTIVKYLKGIGCSLLAGSLIGGLSFFFNKLILDNPMEIDHGIAGKSSEARLLPGGLATGLMGLNKETFHKYTPEEFMKFSAAEAGAWSTLAAAKGFHDYYKDGYNIHVYDAKRENKKETIKENYFPY